MMSKCNICNQRVQSHSYKLKCFACHGIVHLKCLPIVSHTDSIYVERTINKWLCSKCAETEFPFNHFSEDEDFIKVLSENWSSVSSIHLNHLNSLEFNPFDTNDGENLPLQNIDPDLQFYNDSTYLENVSNCQYYNEESFIKKCTEVSADSNCFSLIHLNIRSIPKNLSQFEDYLHILNLSFTVVGISETWLNVSNKDCYALEDYNHYSLCRSNRSGGGVSIFVKKSMPFKCRPELMRNMSEIEAIFIEISREDSGLDKDVIVGMIYRPPNQDLNVFIETIREILETVKTEKKLLYLMGDFNINLLESDRHLQTSEFLDLLYSYCMFPLVTKPTRITSNSSTLIDNIYLNDISAVNTFSGLLYTEISDHLPIFTVNHKSRMTNTSQHRKSRLFTSKNFENFENRLIHLDWTDVLSKTNGREAFKLFYEKFCHVYDQCFPLKEIKMNYQNRKPWLSDGIKKSIKMKNKLYLNQLQNPSVSNIEKYKVYKTHLNRLLRISERKHYEETLKENKYNSRKLWSVLRDVINKKKSSPVPTQFMINGKKESDKGAIANKFNLYFTNIGNDLAKKIPLTALDPLSYINRTIPESIFLAEVNSKEVENIIQSMKNASAGHDGIHSKVLKKSYRLYLQPLLHVLKLSFSQGFFPDEMKIAKVIPIYKSGDTMSISNYRPVSILPLFSKILERLMYNRILSFINKHNILYKYQFGFRNNHSTNMALVILVDKILSAIDKGDLVVGVFLDFQKAFDTVNHGILLNKLYRYGIRGVAYSWLNDYLKGRKQFVSFSNKESEKLGINCGVPQGSILGPLLFLLYVNDLMNISDVIIPILFADDTNVFVNGRNLHEIINTMNSELKKVVEWLSANKLSLNVKKTHYMVFSSRRQIANNANGLYINNTRIDKEEFSKFLGVTIDSKLNWEKHISNVKGKVARGLGIINRARRSLDISSLETLYYSMVYPHLSYCIEVWGKAPSIFIDSLFGLQKKATRIIKSAPYRTSTDPLFRELKLLKLYQIYTHSILMLVFKFLRGLLPNIFHDFYTRNSDICSRETRQNDLLHLPRCKTVLYQKSARFAGAKEWNSKAKFLNRQCSQQTFRRRLKQIILDKNW